ncbi:hypothetical protein AB4Z09_25825 [Rhodococcus sp. TAF43]|uniref:hypothetical protein n=1 Tax=unclassified Rhodococcus (in: high G+C Gram-positive bacteria) TaxID=192944 RepID=UPI003D1BAD3C
MLPCTKAIRDDGHVALAELTDRKARTAVTQTSGPPSGPQQPTVLRPVNKSLGHL